MVLNLSLLRKHPQWPLVKKILDSLSSKGYKAYLAGGCVRDLVLGVLPNDIDIASSAPPEVVESLFAKTIDIGKDFGTIIVVEGQQQIEVTSFRKDGRYEDGRRPASVEFSNEKEDASRRDFTINAMFFDVKEQKLIDYFAGLSDIDKHCIRTVGDPYLRFEEDKLRLLRALRFSSQLAYEIEDETLKAIKDLSSTIQVVSKERILTELQKLCQGKNYKKALLALFSIGLWREIFAISSATKYPSESTLTEYSLSGYIEILAYMCWWHLEKDNINLLKILDSWPLSKKNKQDLKKILEVHKALGSQLKVFEKIKKFDFEYNYISLQLWKLTENDPQKISFFLQRFTSMCDRSGGLIAPLLKGGDLLALGYEPGIAIKEILDKAYERQLTKKITNKQVLLKQLKA